MTHTHQTLICQKLSGCDCEKLHVVEKRKYAIVVLNRIMGQKHSYFIIVPLVIWSQFRSLDKVSIQKRNAVHLLIKSHTSDTIILMHLRKFHYNILCRSEMGELDAEVLAGRAKTIRTKHYLIHELDEMVKQYDSVMSKFTPTQVPLSEVNPIINSESLN